jgi:hypothetical protein
VAQSNKWTRIRCPRRQNHSHKKQMHSIMFW